MEYVFAVIFTALLTLGALSGIKIILGRSPWENYDLDKILVDLGVPALLFAMVVAVAYSGDIAIVLAGSIGMLIVHLGFVGYHKFQRNRYSQQNVRLNQSNLERGKLPSEQNLIDGRGQFR